MTAPARDKPLLGDQSFGLSLLSPALALLACLAVYPILRVLWLSFFAQNLATGLQPRFIGADNFVRVAYDGHFWTTVRVTLVFTFFAVAIELVLGVAFAVLLNARFAGRTVARAVALVPWALPTSILALAWIWIFNDQFGVINDLLRRLNGVIGVFNALLEWFDVRVWRWGTLSAVPLLSQDVAWLARESTAMASIVFADVWKTTPFVTIIVLAGLQDIPGDVYEAASIDGAGRLTTFSRITLPLLMPSILLALVFRMIQSFGIFDLVYVMTGGGPGGATETVAIYSYRTFLRYLDFGYGAAVIVASFLVMAVLTTVIYLPLAWRWGRNR